MNLSISLTVNNVRRDVELEDPRVTLLDLLRERLHLTGTKRDATAVNTAHARSWSTADGSIRAWLWRSAMTAPMS